MCLSSRNFADAPCELYVHAVEWTFLLRVSPWVQVYLREAVPGCAVPVLLSLILYKVVDPSKAIRDDALQMLETLSLREWAGEQQLSLQTPVIVKYRDEQTDLATTLEAWLR